MPRRILARKVLGDLAYDICEQLKKDADPRMICDSAIKRLSQLKRDGPSYYTDWGRMSEPLKRKVKKVELEDDFEVWKEKTFGSCSE